MQRGTARYGTAAQQPQPGAFLELPTAPAEVEAKGPKSTHTEEAEDPFNQFLLFGMEPSFSSLFFIPFCLIILKLEMIAHSKLTFCSWLFYNILST